MQTLASFDDGAGGDLQHDGLVATRQGQRRRRRAGYDLNEVTLFNGSSEQGRGRDAAKLELRA
jgi:hypothetical protein